MSEQGEVLIGLGWADRLELELGLGIGLGLLGSDYGAEDRAHWTGAIGIGMGLGAIGMGMGLGATF